MLKRRMIGRGGGHVAVHLLIDYLGEGLGLVEDEPRGSALRQLTQPSNPFEHRARVLAQRIERRRTARWRPPAPEPHPADNHEPHPERHDVWTEPRHGLESPGI